MWKFDGEPVGKGRHGYTIANKVTGTQSSAVESTKNSTFRLEAVSVENGGKYKCEACNVGGCSAKEIRVYVNGEPTR